MEDTLELDKVGSLSIKQLLLHSPAQSTSSPSERARQASAELRQKLFKKSALPSTAHHTSSRVNKCSSGPSDVLGYSVSHVLKWSLLCVGCLDGAIACWHRSALSNVCAGDTSEAVASNDGFVLHDAHAGAVNCLTHVSAKRELYCTVLLSGSSDMRIKVWDLNQRSIKNAHVQTLSGHTGSITSLTRAAEEYIASGSTDCTVRTWAMKRHREAALYPFFVPHRVLGLLHGWVRSLSFGTAQRATDNGMLYAADTYSYVYTFQASRDLHGYATFELGATFDGRYELATPLFKAHEHEPEIGISYMHYEASENTLFVGAHDHSFKVYDTLSYDLTYESRKRQGSNVAGVTYDRRSRLAIIANSTGGAAVYDCATSKVVLQQQLTHSPVKSVIVIPFEEEEEGKYGTNSKRSDCLHIAAVTANFVQCWLLRRNVRYRKLPHAHEGAVMHVLAKRTPELDSADFHEGFEELVFSAGQDNVIKQWEGFQFHLVRQLRATTTAGKDGSKALDDEITAVHFSEHADVLITGHESGTVILWKPESGHQLRLTDSANRNVHSNAVTSISVGKPLGCQQIVLVSVDFDGAVVLWDLGRAASQASVKLSARSKAIESPLTRVLYEAHWQEVLAVVVGNRSKSTRSSVIVSAGNDCVATVRDAKTLSVIKTYELHDEPIACLSLDSELVVSGSEDCTVHVWSWQPCMEGNSPRSVLRGHTAAITSIEVVPSPASHYNGSNDNNGLSAPAETQQPMLLTASHDGTLRIWLHRVGQCVQIFSHKMEIGCIAKRLKTMDVLAGLKDGSIIEFQAHHDDNVRHASLYGVANASRDDGHDDAASINHEGERNAMEEQEAVVESVSNDNEDQTTDTQQLGQIEDSLSAEQ